MSKLNKNKKLIRKYNTIITGAKLTDTCHVNTMTK